MFGWKLSVSGLVLFLVCVNTAFNVTWLTNDSSRLKDTSWKQVDGLRTKRQIEQNTHDENIGDGMNEAGFVEGEVKSGSNKQGGSGSYQGRSANANFSSSLKSKVNLSILQGHDTERESQRGETTLNINPQGNTKNVQNVEVSTEKRESQTDSDIFLDEEYRSLVEPEQTTTNLQRETSTGLKYTSKFKSITSKYNKVSENFETSTSELMHTTAQHAIMPATPPSPARFTKVKKRLLSKKSWEIIGVSVFNSPKVKVHFSVDFPKEK